MRHWEFKEDCNFAHPLKTSQLSDLEWQGPVTGISVKNRERTEGRISDFAHGNLGRQIRAGDISIRFSRASLKFPRE